MVQIKEEFNNFPEDVKTFYRKRYAEYLRILHSTQDQWERLAVASIIGEYQVIFGADNLKQHEFDDSYLKSFESTLIDLKLKSCNELIKTLQDLKDQGILVFVEKVVYDCEDPYYYHIEDGDSAVLGENYETVEEAIEAGIYEANEMLNNKNHDTEV